MWWLGNKSAHQTMPQCGLCVIERTVSRELVAIMQEFDRLRLRNMPVQYQDRDHEMRRHPRYPVLWKSFVTPANDIREETAVIGKINDVSQSGLRFVSEVRLTEKSRLFVTIAPPPASPTEHKRIELIAEVVYSVLSGNHLQSGMKIVEFKREQGLYLTYINTFGEM